MNLDEYLMSRWDFSNPDSPMFRGFDNGLLNVGYGDIPDNLRSDYQSLWNTANPNKLWLGTPGASLLEQNDPSQMQYLSKQYGQNFGNAMDLVRFLNGAGQVGTDPSGVSYYQPNSGNVVQMPPDYQGGGTFGAGLEEKGWMIPLAVATAGAADMGMFGNLFGGTGGGSAIGGGAGGAEGGAMFDDFSWLENLINDSTGWTTNPSLADLEGFQGLDAAGNSIGGNLAGAGAGASGPFGASGGNFLNTIGNLFNSGYGGTGALSNLGSLSSLIGGGLQGLGAYMGAGRQADAANQASANQLAMFNTLNQQGAPYRQAAYGALGTIGSMMPQFTHSFDANDLKTHLAPNYDFMLNQGLNAVQNRLNVSNGALSGNAVKGINDYAQDYAGNAYQQAFNNYNAQQTNIFNRLSNIAGLGTTANQTTAGAGSTLGVGSANALQNAGAASGGGIVGATNALSGGLNNALGWYMLPQFLNYGANYG